MLTKLNEIIEISKSWNQENDFFECDLILNEGGEHYQAYEVSIANRDVLFFTETAVLNYTIDTIGSKDYLNLVSIERD